MRLLGTSEDTGKLLGLDKEWLVPRGQDRRQLGRDLRSQRGRETPLALPRGVNALWNKGGIVYAPPGPLTRAFE
jgi:general L-amino acid transport system substrate-binding protein